MVHDWRGAFRRGVTGDTEWIAQPSSRLMMAKKAHSHRQ